MGGIPAAVSLTLSFLSVLLMWVFALSFSFLVAFLLPFISSSPVPYVSSPLLVVGLFGAPAFLGALIGQHLGFLLLQKYLLNAHSKRRQLPPIIKAAVVKMEAERWLFKAGSFQWLILLILGNYFKIGSSYVALVWLVSPAFACNYHYLIFSFVRTTFFFHATKFWLNYPDGFFEATLTSERLPKPLKLITLILGLATPILFSAGIFIRLAAILIGGMVRFDRYILFPLFGVCGLTCNELSLLLSAFIMMLIFIFCCGAGVTAYFGFTCLYSTKVYCRVRIET